MKFRPLFSCLRRLVAPKAAQLTIIVISTAATTPVAAAKEPYNVLLLIMDDASPLLHSVFQESPVQTPSLERLAAQSTWFSRGYTYPGCCISRTAFMTGIRPSTSGVYYNGQSYREVDGWISGVENVAQRFKAEGYLTAQYGKIFHNRYQDLDKHSWSEGYFVPYSNERESELLNHVIPGTLTEIPDGPDNYTWGILPDDWDRDDPEKMQQDTRNAARSVKFLEQEHNQPFFLAYGCWRPHVHWTVPKRYYDRFPLDEVEIPAGFRGDDLEDLPKAGRFLATHRGFHDKIVKNALWKRALQALYASTAYADEQVGKVLDALDSSPHGDNTIVIFLADNGWHTGQKNHWSKFTLWDLATRVPIAIRVPGQSPQIIHSPVSSLDFYPTLMNLCNLPGPDTHDLEGVDLTPLLTGSTKERGKPVLLTYGLQNHAVQDERFRYIRYQDGTEELYDQSADPHEWKNLADDPSYNPVKKNLSQFFPTVNAEPVPFVGADINIVTPDAYEFTE